MPMEVAQSAEPTTKSHALVVEHDESLVPKRTTRDALLAKSEITRKHNWVSKLRQTKLQTLVDMPTNHMGFSASSSYRDVVGAVVMGDVPTPSGRGATSAS